MKLLYRILLCSLLAFAVLNAKVGIGQAHLKFQHLTVDNGLSNNVVTSILQDRLGFMWIGTEDGLNRYDGKNIVIFKHTPTDSSSLADNLIGEMVEDGEGNLWIGTIKALHRYNPRSGKFKRYHRNLKDSSSYQGSDWDKQLRIAFNKKEVWLKAHHPDSKGICYQRYNPQTDKFERYVCPLSEAQQKVVMPHGLFEYQGELYGVGGFFRFDRAQNKFIAIHQNQTPPIKMDHQAFALDGKGKVWFVGKYGTMVYDLKSQQYIQTWADNRSINGAMNYCLDVTTYQVFFSPTTNTLWAATFEGLAQMNLQTGGLIII